MARSAGNAAADRRLRRPCLLAAAAAGGCLAVSAMLTRLAAASSRAFLAGTPALRSHTVSRPRGIARQAYSFGVVESDDHVGLVVENVDAGVQVKTTGGEQLKGHWNTVLGDADVPASGRSYWEVKIVEKPTDAWEYIGVVEKDADVTVPLTRNRKGKGYFIGSTWGESMVYKYMEVDTKKYQAEELNMLKNIRNPETAKLIPEKDWDEAFAEMNPKMWNCDGIHIGSDPDYFPPLKPGMVVGVDVDMDKGSVSLWSNGKYLGPICDHASGKPLDLKGKKLVPAVSVFGREAAAETEATVMELRTGLEPPSLP